MLYPNVILWHLCCKTVHINYVQRMHILNFDSRKDLRSKSPVSAAWIHKGTMSLSDESIRRSVQ